MGGPLVARVRSWVSQAAVVPRSEILGEHLYLRGGPWWWVMDVPDRDGAGKGTEAGESVVRGV